MLLDARARPPESLKALFKAWQKGAAEDIELSDNIIDLSLKADIVEASICKSAEVSGEQRYQAFDDFLAKGIPRDATLSVKTVPRYEVIDLPGLYVYPAFFPPCVQSALLDKILHRDLSNPMHKTNLHLHYDIPYPEVTSSSDTEGCGQSFFLVNPAERLRPQNAAIHKSLTVKQMMERKLRWITLGGQYDWTAKEYPAGEPPPFPSDISRLLKGLFPTVDAQAAIVNLYTPGDTLSVHRDVSEECDRDLISVSIGCDGIFVVGDADGTRTATLRLRSGDVLLMSGSARYAWHGIPRIIAGTCPSWLQPWPDRGPESVFGVWKGWMTDKRINLNVRQMRAQ